MTLYRELSAIAAALNAESWSWLQDNNVVLARALEAEVTRGATADEIRRFVMRHTGRTALAARMEQAAAYLLSETEAAQ